MSPFRRASARVAQAAVVAAVGLSALVGVAAPVGAAASVDSAASVDAVSTTSDTGLAGVSVAPGWRREMLASINAVRVAVGVPPLRPCPALRRSAQEYAMLMSTRDHYGHIGPDGSQPGERMLRQGYRWRVFAENIAAGQRSVAQVMTGIVGSPSHHANLVNPAYRHVGLGHAFSATGEYRDYWVQDFGRGRGC